MSSLPQLVLRNVLSVVEQIFFAHRISIAPLLGFYPLKSPHTSVATATATATVYTADHPHRWPRPQPQPHTSVATATATATVYTADHPHRWPRPQPQPHTSVATATATATVYTGPSLVIAIY
ncbi:hypothetical protein QR680_000685 [Steinernema hermaphroditum]|uniref:Uncharacterized protein n=1 Tax=Steinernema hermaphroditum TaxID=289476 RepID=A0AA39GYA3_9BILA|nr:hypothetical protein QR680_000685 [Steinernema hermaphroditum]